jgi:hypothetical protein
MTRPFCVTAKLVSVGVALALGCPLAVEPGGATFALRSFLRLGGTAVMFGRVFALPFSLGLLLFSLDTVGLGFLTMPGDLAANALTLTLTLATPLLGHSSGREQRHRGDDHDDGDHGNR